MSGSTDEKSSGWWKPILVALGAAAAAVVAWGWLSPEPEEEEGEIRGAGAEAEGMLELVAAPDSQPPPWVKPTIVWTIALVVGVAAALTLLGILQQVVLWILLALFFSFALEPAVNRLARRGWRRGSATGLLLALTFVLLMGVGLIFVVTIVRGRRSSSRASPSGRRPSAGGCPTPSGSTPRRRGYPRARRAPHPP